MVYKLRKYESRCYYVPVESIGFATIDLRMQQINMKMAVRFAKPHMGDQAVV